MATVITAQPASTPIVAGQYLIFTLDETTTTPDRYIVQVYRSTSTSSVGSEQAKIYITPNASNVCHFDLSHIAEGILEFPLSKGGVPIHAVQDASKIFNCDELCLLKFTIRAGQYNGTTETLNEDSDEVYLIRGVEQLSSGLNPSFSDYYPTSSSKKGWLTDRDVNSANRIDLNMASDDEAVALIMLTDNMGASTAVDQIRITAYDASGTSLGSANVSVSASTTTKNNLLCVPIGPAHWSFLGLSSSAQYVEFYAWSTTAGVQKSRRLRVNLDCRPLKHEATQLAWINSRGGWDYLRFDSRAPKTISVEGKTYRKSVSDYRSATFSLESNGRQYDTYAKTGRERFTLQNLTFTEEERDLMQYLLRSPVVSMRRGTEAWKPCTVLTNSLSIEPAGSRLYNVSLDVEVAQDIRC